MPTNVISYEVLRVGSELDKMKQALNEMGRQGYQLHHTRTDESGQYTFIFSKDTGIAADEETAAAGGWIDDGFVNEETSWT